MSTNTNIEWCDHTFNPWTGCTPVSPACDHCYAEGWAKRSGQVQWGPKAPRRRTSIANWNLPRRWNAQAEAFMAQHGRRQRVFCASLADVFDNAVDPAWRDDLATLILETPNLDWLLLTKRIGNASAMLSDMFLDGPPPNIRIGASITNQPEADRDITKLLRLGLPNFLSMEPLLGAVDISGYMWPVCGWWRGPYKTYREARAAGAECGLKRQALVSAQARFLDWVIVGGESGPGSRPMHPAWARGLRDQCSAAGVPFLFKQWGEWVPYEHSAQPPFLCAQNGHEIDGHALPDFESDDYDPARSKWHMDWASMLLTRKVGKKAAGRLLDGREWNGVPE